MSARRDLTSGVAFGLGIVAVAGIAGYFGWQWLGPQLVGIAGAAGAAAGEEATHQITTGVQGAAPGIGADVGRGAVEGAAARAGELLGGPTDEAPSGSVLLGGTPVEIV